MLDMHIPVPLLHGLTNPSIFLKRKSCKVGIGMCRSEAIIAKESFYSAPHITNISLAALSQSTPDMLLR